MARVTKTIYMDEELAEWLEREAEKENRPLSNFLETLLIRKRERESEPVKDQITAAGVPVVVG